MICLLDVNVWLALAIADHVHHAAALDWLYQADRDEIVFCRVTQHGFLRQLTNRRVMGDDVLSPAGAWDVFDAWRQATDAKVVPEPPKFEDVWRAATQRPHGGPNFWTDAYLVAFAAAAGYTVVTFDQGFDGHRGARVRILPT